jgi:hypothetical protein
MVHLGQVSSAALACLDHVGLSRLGKTLLARAVAATLNTNFLKVVSSAVRYFQSPCIICAADYTLSIILIMFFGSAPSTFFPLT